MNHKPRIVLLLANFIVLFVFLGTAYAQTQLPENYGAKGALQDSKITLEEALVYAIEDEYLAQARYDAVIGKFGAIRPFSNIKIAEQRHITALLPLFKKYNVQIPDDKAKQYVSAPATIKEALQQGVEGEVDNIAMYEKLSSIPDLPEDVRAVLTQLGEASKNHLRAFKRGLEREQ